MTLRAWYLGNTTIRNAKRLKDGLRALVNSNLHGNLEGTENEQEFARLLDQAGVVYLSRLHENPDSNVSDVGRKWRAALMQLGFIRPSSDVLERLGLNYQSFTITPNGLRLLEASTLPMEQECFLRALLAHQIPSSIESFPGEVFSPLRIVLETLSLLEIEGHESAISKEEMGTIVQLVNSVHAVPDAVTRIVNFRSQISIYDNPKQRRDFIREYRESYSAGTPTQSADTLIDYADSNFRYLKLTGLFVENGNKLRFAEHKKTMVRQILSEPYYPIPSEQYLEILWDGLSLPTDDVLRAIESIQSLLSFLQEHGESVTVPNLLQMPVADLSQLRLELEDTWLKVLEKHYAQNQINEWQDIVEYLRALTQPLRGRGIIPRGEAPAYLEWVLWRAFLAINSLANEPWEARRFRIDEEFLPLGTAPGGGPDMILEFEHYVIVVEVTLTSSSRQEAAEGEPVRRHVAQLHDEYEARGKRVYGLFIANNIDTNTAETFRIGVWYRQDDSRMALDIVPLTLGQFADLFEAGFRSGGRLDCTTVEQVIRDCLAESRAEAPEWKRRIDQRVQNVVQRLV